MVVAVVAVVVVVPVVVNWRERWTTVDGGPVDGGGGGCGENGTQARRSCCFSRAAASPQEIHPQLDPFSFFWGGGTGFFPSLPLRQAFVN